MSGRATNKVAQITSKVKSKVRHASVNSVRPKSSKLGREIFAYHHLQTNQVVYSLTKGLNNNAALKQLPYNGKKTVPSALRKDLWSPLACITFPAGDPASAQYGLKTLHKLREYRKLHETEWPPEFALDEKGQPLTRRLRGRKLCDQKANSVADMAAALKGVTMREVGVEAGGEAGEGKREGVGRMEGLVRATVLWRDVLDAEFAESWPETVVHDKWETTRNNRKGPRREEVVDEQAPAETAVGA